MSSSHVQTASVVIEYIWIDDSLNTRSKTRVIRIQADKLKISDIPEWNYDGSSTGQATGQDSEVIIRPRKLYGDPIRKGNCLMVICDTYNPDGSPHSTNTRYNANKLFEQHKDLHTWFGLEQEYFILSPDTNEPLGYNPQNTQGQYYCSVGTNNAYGRKIVDKHMFCCIYAGINISGTNSEVAPGQWEFQIGPCEGINAGDDLWVARHLLHKVAEEENVIITFDPKPLKGNWNGSGCHTNVSTIKTRNGYDTKTGLDCIYDAISKLEPLHNEHMKVYGSGNEERMTGDHETASYTVFTSGVANRGASIRIGNTNKKNKCGYFEDRRPSSNCDPYLTTSTITNTIA